MQIPAAMFIESAVDTKIEDWVKADQCKELQAAIGANTAEKLNVEFPVSKEFARGYELGLQTARVMLATSPALVLKGVKPDEVL